MAWYWKRKRPLALDLPPPNIEALKRPRTAGVTIDLTETYHALMKDTIRDLVKQEMPDASPEEATAMEEALYEDFIKKEERR